MVRPVETLRSSAPHGSGSPGRASASRSLISSHWFSSSSAEPRVWTRTQPPTRRSPASRNLSSPFSRPARASPTGSQLPVSQSITVPPPYSPLGMVPSKSPYSMGWSSTCTASRRTLGSRLGPLGTAQLTRTPSSSSRRSCVQAARGVLLDAEQAAGQRLRAAGLGPGLGRTLGLGGLAEVALAPVRAQAGHGDQLALRRRWPLRPLASPTLFLRSSIMSTTSPPCRAGAPRLTGARPVLALASISWSRSSR